MQSNVSIFPLKSVTMTNWSQVETPMRTTSMQMSVVWLHVVYGCEASWMYSQIIWNAFGDGLW